MGKYKPKITTKVKKSFDYNSKEYAALKEEVKKRDNYQCVKCGRTDLLQVDHKIPVSMGGRTIKSNLHTLCIYCHIKRPRHNKVKNLLLGSLNYQQGKPKKKFKAANKYTTGRNRRK